MARCSLDAARGGLYMEPNEIDSDFKPYTDGDIRWVWQVQTGIPCSIRPSTLSTQSA